MSVARKKYFFLFFITALFISNTVSAQKFIAIDKSGKEKRLRFYTGDKINIRLNDENFFRSGYIDAIADTSFIFEGKNIPLSWVNAILVYKDEGGHAAVKELSNKL